MAAGGTDNGEAVAQPPKLEITDDVLQGVGLRAARHAASVDTSRLIEHTQKLRPPFWPSEGAHAVTCRRYDFVTITPVDVGVALVHFNDDQQTLVASL